MPERTNLQLITERLPFAIDDSEAVNTLYAEYTDTPDPRKENLIELWTYGYVYRYVAGKDASGSVRQASDVEELITTIYEKVQRSRGSIRNPDKYAHWISVVAKNTFINYVKRRRIETTSINEPQPPPIEDREAVAEIDGSVGLMRSHFRAAIRRLPPYLRRVAEMYYLDDRSFAEIAEEIDKDVPTVRTYKSRALKALREDERLRDVVDEL